MKWYLEILDLIFFWVILGVGFKFFWEHSLWDWEFWLIALPLVIAGHWGIKWIVRKNEELKRGVTL